MIMYIDVVNKKYLWAEEYVLENNSRILHTYEEIDTSKYFSVIPNDIKYGVKQILDPLMAFYSKDNYFFKSEADYILWKLKYGV